jgi:hypothetical protein
VRLRVASGTTIPWRAFFAVRSIRLHWPLLEGGADNPEASPPDLEDEERFVGDHDEDDERTLAELRRGGPTSIRSRSAGVTTSGEGDGSSFKAQDTFLGMRFDSPAELRKPQAGRAALRKRRHAVAELGTELAIGRNPVTASAIARHERDFAFNVCLGVSGVSAAEIAER